MSRRALITAVASLLLLALTSLMGCVVAAPYHGGHGYRHGHHRPAPWAAPYHHQGWRHGHWR